MPEAGCAEFPIPTGQSHHRVQVAADGKGFLLEIGRVVNECKGASVVFHPGEDNAALVRRQRAPIMITDHELH